MTVLVIEPEPDPSEISVKGRVRVELVRDQKGTVPFEPGLFTRFWFWLIGFWQS